jgi:hypothetical protein
MAEQAETMHDACMQPLKCLNLPPLLLEIVVARSRDPLPGRIQLRDHSSLSNIDFGRSIIASMQTGIAPRTSIQDVHVAQPSFMLFMTTRALRSALTGE